MLAVIPSDTVVTIVVTIVISLCGGVALLLQIFLKDLYARIDRVSQRINAIDQRIDDLLLKHSENLAQINKDLAIFPEKERHTREKLANLNEQHQTIVGILNDILISTRYKKL